MKQKIFIPSMLTVMILLSSLFAYAQEDETGCKDHPFFTRMPNFFLSECLESYNQFDIVVGDTKKQPLEGTVYKYTYYIKDNVEKLPSSFQIMKNYENAVLAKGGERVYLSSKADDDGFVGATFRMNFDGDTYWLTLDYFNGSEAACDGYVMGM